MTKTNAKADRNTAPPRIALRVDIALLVCGLFYILAEFIFNARLLDTASDIAATADDLRDVEYLGRAVSGVGLTLLVAGFFARDGFRMSRLSDQIVFGLLALVCPLLFLLSPLAAAGGGLDPAGTTFTQLITGRGAPVDLDVPPPDASMAWIILPFIGIFMVLVAHYLKLHRVMVVAGLAAMTWPAMFFGQKIVIERFMIHPTTWETRLDARYMQMMRTGFGHGIIALRDLRFDESSDPALRTFLVLMGSLFMQFPDEAKEMLREKQDDIVRLIIARSDVQNIDTRYEDYLAQGERFRSEFFAPYENASDLYAQALSEPFLKEASARAMAMAKKGADAGWLKMRDALGTCRGFAARQSGQLYTSLLDTHRTFAMCQSESCRGRVAFNYQIMIRRMTDMRMPFDYWCEESGIDPATIGTHHQLGAAMREVAARETFMCKPAGIDRLQERLMPLCTQEIHKQTGFSGTIRTRADFEDSPQLHKNVRKQLLDELRREQRLITFMLPEDWRMEDVETLEDALARAIMTRASVEWTQNRRREDESGTPSSLLSGIRPGMDFDAFVRMPAVQRQLRDHLGDMYYPGFTFSMTRDQFAENVIVPEIKRRAAAFIRDTEERGRRFANGQPLESEGKDAVRFIYIPSIALFISLFLVVLTLARCLIAAARIGWRTLHPDAPPSPKRLAAAWAVVVVFIAGFPYAAGGRTAMSESYQSFLARSFERAPLTSLVIDWTMRAEPIIYSAGKSLLDAAGIAPAHAPRNIDGIAPVIIFDRAHDALVRAVQDALVKEGLLDPSYGGGLMNEATHEALRRYQSRRGLTQTGTPDAPTLQSLGIAAPETAKETPEDTPEETPENMPDDNGGSAE